MDDESGDFSPHSFCKIKTNLRLFLRLKKNDDDEIAILPKRELGFRD